MPQMQHSYRENHGEEARRVLLSYLPELIWFTSLPGTAFPRTHRARIRNPRAAKS